MDEPDDFTWMPEVAILTSEVRAGIKKGLSGNFKFEFDPSEVQWDRLERALQGYQKAASYWAGFLTSRQIGSLRTLQRQAQRLLASIEKEVSAGGRKMLEADLESVSLDTLKMALLELSRGDLGSPKLDTLGVTDWERYLDGQAAELQAGIDAWWAAVTGAPPQENEDGGSPYSYFLSQVYRYLVTPGKPLGSSRTAAKARRRTNKAAAQRRKQASETLRRLFDPEADKADG